jgi:hypothetical protein
MTPDTSDIARRLRQTRANMLGTDDEQHYWDCHEAASHIELLEASYKCSGSALAVIDGGFKNAVAEVERLRLTDAERKAVEWFASYGYSGDGVPGRHSATLRGLLERFSQFAKSESDSPKPIANCDATPTPPSTPGECTVPPEWTSRPYWVDPPSGWRYGFPELYDPQADGDLTEWLIANGYPEHLARQGLACTFSEYRLCTEDGGK